MMSNRFNLDNFITRILKQDKIQELINDYEEFLNYNFSLSVPHLRRIQIFINEFYIPMQLSTDKSKEKFDENNYFINLFKKLLINLFTHSKKLNFYTLKGEKND